MIQHTQASITGYRRPHCPKCLGDIVACFEDIEQVARTHKYDYDTSLCVRYVSKMYHM